MEKCIEKYGRNYKSIIDINDLAASFPSDNLYIKFHEILMIVSQLYFL
jgi:hypothetical protein